MTNGEWNLDDLLLPLLSSAAIYIYSEREEEREMVSREHKRAALHEKLQVLRSLTNSHALRKSSIIMDASKYIKDLKQKVERLNQEIASAQNNIDHNAAADQRKNNLPKVTVETLEQGFMVSVLSEKNCPGLLVSLLEAFEELGLTVFEAKASCAEAFRLQAFGRRAETVDAQVVRDAIVRSIKSFFGNKEQE